MLLATVRYFQEMERINPDFLRVIENPKGYMRKQEVMEPFHLHTVSYCKYGLTVQKHTDLFSNMKFNLAPPCDGNKAGHLNHERVLDQGWDKRSVVPSLLAKEIVAQMVHERERREKRKEEINIIREADLRGEVAEQASYVGQRDPICVVEPLETKKTLWPRDYGIPESLEDVEGEGQPDAGEAGETSALHPADPTHPGRIEGGEEEMRRDNLFSGKSPPLAKKGGEAGEIALEGISPALPHDQGENVRGLDSKEMQGTFPPVPKKEVRWEKATKSRPVTPP
jgi:hypothetical protein